MLALKTEFALKFFKPGGAADTPDPPPRTPMAIRVRPVQRYSEVFGLRAEGQGFVVVFDLSPRFASLLLRWKAADTVYVVLSLSFQVWRYSATVAMSLVSTPSNACQSSSACMIARSLAYAYFLETVIGRSEM